MLKEALEYLIEQGERTFKSLVVGDTTYTNNAVYPVKPVGSFFPNVLKLSTLDALCTLAASEEVKKIKETASDLYAVIVSPSYIEFLTAPQGNLNERQLIASVSANIPDDMTGMFYPQSEFVLKLRTGMKKTDGLATAVEIISALQTTEDCKVEDNGLSQDVTVHKGVKSYVVGKIPESLDLQPYRTFAEVEQPESPFMLRIRDDFSCMIAPVDGGAWQLEAIKNVAAYLKDHMPKEVTILD